MQKTDLQKHLQAIQDRTFNPIILKHNSFRACLHRSAQNLGLIKNGELTAKGRQHLTLQF
ncbi:hypothetical protein MK904_12955 [Loigolactobacillus coryniformis]|jgi:hypothetical protein|uniref:Uncharacterized protein n=3 Tax=Loigolactobacillus coryniformis TaxID=1610 RepID=A0A0R1FBJ7_9LACO|nr:hypothetical protein [Loigolactobacillus coryniformis]MDT3392364.1 hypothetical protein [Bacillota bacterium]OEH89653.1 hypothetical protein ATO00_09350 [Loigolactobacillus coryniformis subsp. coryniformis]RRG01208.1 MAG: hypothetical protein DUD28_12345 [Lactobacillus sp.]ATO43106.1 hypothetical protein LC20004_03965 [Loigolactobacillus coryniformis subsp. torquens DSM 20004 = KCTC 3535]ATO54862.1 hypothetical protein LC20001_04160 [Loigolactobacillus coryniformis subsp. coryniformis KCTC 